MSDELTLLVEKKQQLEERLEKIKKDVASGLSADSEERAVELENRDVLLEIARVTEQELDGIKAKLDEIKS